MTMTMTNERTGAMKSDDYRAGFAAGKRYARQEVAAWIGVCIAVSLILWLFY
jgi:hypothetical protein